MGDAVDRLLKQSKSSGPSKSGKAAPAGKKSGSAVAALLGGSSSSGGGGGGDEAPAKKKSFFGKIAADAGALVSGVPKGLIGLGHAIAEVPSASKALVETNVKHGHVPFTAYKPGQEQAIDEDLHKAAPHLFGLVDSNAQTLRDVGAGRVLTKYERGAHTEDPKKLYSEHPLSSFVNDVANVTAVAAPALRAAGAGAEAGSVAARAGKVAEVAQKISDAPMAPYRLAAKLARTGFDLAGESEGRAGNLIRLAKLDPSSRLTRHTVLTPAMEAEADATGAVVSRAQKLEKLLPEKTDQIAATLVGEGEASALSLLRRRLSKTDFEAYIGKTYRESVPVEAASLAADIFEGQKTGHPLSAREQAVVDALAEGHAGAGGRAEREKQYVSEGGPGRTEQVTGKFAPLTQVVEDAARRPEEQAARARRLSGQLRDRAELAAARAGERVGEGPRLAGPGRSMQAAGQRVADAERRIVHTSQEAKRALAAASGLEDSARSKVETHWRKSMELQVREHRRALADQLRAEADDYMSQLPEGGPKMPGKWLDKAQGIRHPSRDVADTIAQALGEGYAGRKFFNGQHGLDLYLEEVNRRLNITDETGSGMGQQRVADAVVSIINHARQLRREAQQVERGHIEAGTVPAGSVRDVAEQAVAQHPGVASEQSDVVDRAVGNASRAVEDPNVPIVNATPLERGIAKSMTAEQRVVAAQAASDVAREGLNRPLEQAAEAGRRVGQREGVSAQRVREAESIAERGARVAAKATNRALETRKAAEQSIEAAPARLRPALIRNRDAAAMLQARAASIKAAVSQGAHGVPGAAAAYDQLIADANSLPKTLAELKEAGADFDQFVHIGLEAKKGAGGAPSGVTLPKVRKGRSEHVRTGSPVYDRTIRGQAQAELDQLKVGIGRVAAKKVAGLPFAKKFDSVKAAAAEDYVAWDPASPFEKSAEVNRNTVFIPKHVFEGFRSYFKDPAFDKVLRDTWDPTTRIFKASVLSLSPSWQVGNVIGNTLLATVGAGVPPHRLAIEAVRALKQYKDNGGWDGIAPRRLFSAGPAHEELAYLSERLPKERGKLGRAVNKAGAVSRASYRANEFVDNLTRSAVYAAKRGKGFSEEEAVRQSLNAMGDFSKMTPFEQRVVKRVVPFYAWQRHMTQLAFRLPVENPIRTAWVLHLSSVYGQEDADLPGALQGSIKIPGTDYRLGTGGLNPFGRVNSSLNPRNLAQGLNPLIKVPAQRISGINLYDLKPFSRPGGFTGAPESPSLAKMITDIAPQKRLFEGLNGRGDIVRYDTGSPVIKDGAYIPSDRGGASAIARFFGFPLYSPEAVAGMTTAAERRAGAEAKSDAAYKAKRDDIADSLPYAKGAKTKAKPSTAVQRLLQQKGSK